MSHMTERTPVSPESLSPETYLQNARVALEIASRANETDLHNALVRHREMLEHREKKVEAITAWLEVVIVCSAMGRATSNQQEVEALLAAESIYADRLRMTIRALERELERRKKAKGG